MAAITVLGIGNILMRDEGVGVRLLEAVRAAHQWTDSIEFVDGGAGGLNLLNIIERAKAMVVFDAANMKLTPGEYRIILPQHIADELPEHRVSMHDVPFTETLRLCREFLHCPGEIKVMLIQPKTVEFGRELSDELKTAFDKLVPAAVNLVQEMCAASR